MWYEKLGIKKVYEENTTDHGWWFIKLSSGDRLDKYNRVTIATPRTYKTFQLPWKIIRPIYDYPTYDYKGDDYYQISDEEKEKRGAKVKYVNYADNVYEIHLGGEGYLNIYINHISEPLYNKKNHKDILSFWWYIPWKNSTQVSRRLIDINNGDVWFEYSMKKISKMKDVEIRNKTNLEIQYEESQPFHKIIIVDPYDDEEIEVSVRMSESEYRIGTGFFSILLFRMFKKKETHRYLDMKFSSEFGNRKGSYKGGIIGCSVKINNDETVAEAISKWIEK